MQPPDPLPITVLVTQTLEEMGIPYLIGGSLASILHGMVRTTMDADIVARIQPHQARLFAQVVEADFWVEPESIFSAIQHRSSFSLIHKDTSFKVDVFIYKGRPFDRARFERRGEAVLTDDPEHTAWVASPEDIILAKLEWFEMGGRVSERQWRDILGVIRMQGTHLQDDYLRQWANNLKVSDLLEAALREGRKNE